VTVVANTSRVTETGRSSLNAIVGAKEPATFMSLSKIRLGTGTSTIGAPRFILAFSTMMPLGNGGCIAFKRSIHVKSRVEIDWRDHYWYQQSVLVRVGELTQRPEQWTIERLLRTVWLKPPDDCVVSRINVRKCAANNTRPVLRVGNDRELNPLLPLGVRRSASVAVLT